MLFFWVIGGEGGVPGRYLVMMKVRMRLMLLVAKGRSLPVVVLVVEEPGFVPVAVSMRPRACQCH